MAACFVAAVLLGWFFHRFFFRGYGMGALDIAQLARNLSQGQGFSTDFVRPYLLPLTPIGKAAPDLSNAPLYPLLLGWAFAFLGENNRAIALLPILFFALSACLLFVLARRLTHRALTAGLAVGAYVLSQPVLAAVDSAQPLVLSTCLLLLLLLAITPFGWLADEENPQASPLEVAPSQGAFRHNFLVGVLVGLCFLADYLSLLYTLPLLVWWKPRAALGSQKMPLDKAQSRRVILGMALGFAVIVWPWWWRNYVLTGNPFFSTQWLEIVMNTRTFPGLSLLREASSEPTLWPGVVALGIKLLQSLASFFFALPFLPHIYLTPFVVGAFLVKFEVARINAFKFAFLAALAVYIGGLCVMGRSPEFLLPLLPLLALLGAAAYMHLVGLLLNRLGAAPEGGRKRVLRRLAPALRVMVPLALFALPLARQSVENRGQGAAEANLTAWFEPIGKAIAEDDKRAIASDVPWAVAWYTARRAVWLPNRSSQLAAVERKQPLTAIYLSPAIATPQSGFSNAGEWARTYQGTEEMKGFARNPRPAQRDVLFTKRPTVDEALARLKSQPKNPDHHMLLGQTQLIASRYGEALATFKSLQTLQPQAPHSYWGQGKAYLGLKRPQQALAAFSQAIRRAGNLPPMRIEAQLQSAAIFNGRGDQKRAAPLYEAVLADQPNNPLALNNLAFIYANDRRDLNRALEMARRAAASNPKNGLIRDTLGWVCLRMNRPQEAVLHLREAVRLAPEVSSVHLHLGQALMATGQKQEALGHLQRARALGKSSALKAPPVVVAPLT